MKNYLKTTITLFSMLLCFGIFAQGPPGGGNGGGKRQGRGQQKGGKPDASKILSKLDTNKDKAIDKEEAANDKRGKIVENFETIDTNEDGLIHLEELEASLNNRKKKKRISAEKIIKEVDDNGDGTLNELEVAVKKKKELSKNFNEIDLNEDGELNLEELKTFYTNNDKSKRKKTN